MSLDDLRAAFERHHPLSDDAWRAFAPLVETVRLRKGDVFIRAGVESRHMARVASGLMRAFYLTSDGDEVTTNFCAEGAIVCAYSASLTQRPSTVTIEALEECELQRFEVAAIRALFHRFPEWGHVGRVLTEAYYVFQEQRIADLLTLDASARLARFLETHQALVPRLQQQQIAGYLAISRESLSRIRAKKVRKSGRGGA